MTLRPAEKFSKLKRLVLYSALNSVLLLPFISSIAYATPYGTQGYDTCTYNCKQSSTEVTLPTGLQVSINLTDGQTIPYNGYNVIVTPLNGQGTSFKQVDFYINGALVQTVLPDETGTAKWFWDPRQFPGTDIKIIVTGTNGQSVTEEFHIKIGSKSSPQTTANATSNTSAKTGLGAILQKVYNGAEGVIRAIPSPIVYSFPYFLFILLAINVVLLLLQTKRELKEYHILQALIDRARAVSDAKKTFTELISHYLRTPLTVILGGIDLLENSGIVSSNAIDLKAVTQDMRSKIESLIHETQSITNSRAATVGITVTPDTLALWRQPGLFVPIALIMAIVVPFNYLAAHAGTFSITQINLVAQLILFTILVLITYEVFRRLHLRRRDAQTLQQVLTEEATVNQARDELITRTVTTLNDDLTSLDSLIGRSSTSQTSDFFNRGQKGFHDILTKFAIAGKLRGSYNNEPFVPIKLSELLEKATQNLQVTARERNITIQQTIPDAFFLQVQSPELLAFVFNSLIDNAISYSNDGNTIDVGATTDPSGTTLTIKDHGQGIPADKLFTLFQPFSKVEGAEVFNHEGMGFSLYLDKLILAYLNGSIEITSQPNVETTATVHLPPLSPITA